MFDIIRGHSTKSDIPKRTDAVPRPSEDEEPLFRAPGCPLRTLPSWPQPLVRATTMPDQARQQRRINHTLSSRRSMTTDQRVQHWRQTCHRQSPERSTNNDIRPETVCGSNSNTAKHMIIGNGQSRTIQASGLPDCTDCTILTQTLSRLRQNLVLSKQISAGEINQSHNTCSGTSSDRPAPHATPKSQEQTKSTTTRRTPFPDPQNSQPSERATCPNTTSTSQPQPDQSEPEQYYRNHNPQHSAQSATHALSSQEAPHSTFERSLHLAHIRPRNIQDHPHLRSHASMPLRPHVPQLQEQRRPSNHTDDRDWMA